MYLSHASTQNISMEVKKLCMTTPWFLSFTIAFTTFPPPFVGVPLSYWSALPGVTCTSHNTCWRCTSIEMFLHAPIVWFPKFEVHLTTFVMSLCIRGFVGLTASNFFSLAASIANEDDRIWLSSPSLVYFSWLEAEEGLGNLGCICCKLGTNFRMLVTLELASTTLRRFRKFFSNPC